MGRPKKLIVQKLFSDTDISLKEGSWIEETDIKHPIINSNMKVNFNIAQQTSRGISVTPPILKY